MLLWFAVYDGHAERRFGSLCWILGEDLCGLCGIVTSPQPDHLFGKLRAAFACGMRTLAEGEAEVVVLQLESVRHADVCHRPRAVIRILLIVAAVLQPY